MQDTRETCAICFQNYLVKNTKDHQCPDTFCGACGEQYDPTTEQDENGFHLSEICGANDEEITTTPNDKKEEKTMEKRVSFAEYLNSIQPFTVGLMRSVLANLPEDTQIVFGLPDDFNPRSDFYNVELDWKSPDEDEEYLALTFFLKDNYDARQF
jgi:hypothetical protein